MVDVEATSAYLPPASMSKRQKSLGAYEMLIWRRKNELMPYDACNYSDIRSADFGISDERYQVRMICALRHRVYNVQRERIRQSMRKIDPIGMQLRSGLIIVSRNWRWQNSWWNDVEAIEVAL